MKFPREGNPTTSRCRKRSLTRDFLPLPLPVFLRSLTAMISEGKLYVSESDILPRILLTILWYTVNWLTLYYESIYTLPSKMDKDISCNRTIKFYAKHILRVLKNGGNVGVKNNFLYFYESYNRLDIKQLIISCGLLQKKMYICTINKQKKYYFCISFIDKKTLRNGKTRKEKIGKNNVALVWNLYCGNVATYSTVHDGFYRCRRQS